MPDPETPELSRLEIVEWVGRTGAVVIMRRLEPELTLGVVEAVLEGGMDVVEVTTDSASAFATIGEIRERVGDRALVGAGTVIHAAAAIQAIDAGAQFVVAPNTDEDVIKVCDRLDVPAMPGGFTPTEITRAAELGADVVKVFPARLGGPKYISDVLAPLRGFRLLPTGGVSPDNAGEYIRAGAFAVGIGSALVGSELVEGRDWPGITAAARRLADGIAAARS